MWKQLLLAALILQQIQNSAVLAIAADQYPATCSQSDVATAISAATSGDVIYIPSGECTYTAAVDVDIDSITLSCGYGGGATTILDDTTTASTDTAFYVTADNVRITGCTFTRPSDYDNGNDFQGIVKFSQALSFRVDNCTFYDAPKLMLTAWQSSGVIDSNQFLADSSVSSPAGLQLHDDSTTN